MSAAWGSGICQVPGCYSAAAPRDVCCRECRADLDLSRQLELSLALARERHSHEERGKRV